MQRHALGCWIETADASLSFAGGTCREYDIVLSMSLWIGPFAWLVALAPPPDVVTPISGLNEVTEGPEGND